MSEQDEVKCGCDEYPECTHVLYWFQGYKTGALKARKEALEEAAQVIDQCNREGPYNAIQGASRIREIAELEKHDAKGVKWVKS